MSDAPQQIVTFRVADALFAADVRVVERVLRYVSPAPVPNAAPWIAGVIDHQQRVLPVVSMRARLGLAEIPPLPTARILVLSLDEPPGSQAASEWIGAAVDAVLDVVTVQPADLAPPPPIFRGLAAGYLRSIVRRPEGLVMLLDTRALLTAPERLELRDVAEATSGV